MGELLLMMMIPPAVGLATYAVVRLMQRKPGGTPPQRTAGPGPRVKP